MNIPINSTEPKKAFQYKPPDDITKEKYHHIFKLTDPLEQRMVKDSFDKLVAALALLVTSPFLLCLKSLYIIEGLLIPENKGPMLFSYNAVSAGRVFPKYKIRLIKMKYIDEEGAKRGDWKSFSAEWSEDSRTYLGSFVKKFYLDELPQFYNVLQGDMSIVGPRPLAVHHYERDLKQGNISRMLLKGGMIGLGHVMKGTPEMGNPKYEYEYIDNFIKNTSLALLWLDLTIIYKGIKVILQGKGL